MSEFHITFPKFQKNIDDGNVVFSIGNIKSRVPSVIYFKFHCYDLHDDEILVNSQPVHVGKRFVVTPLYREYLEEFEIPENILSRTFSFEIELILLGITSENPCWFNQIMFEKAPHTEYHKPDESFEKSKVLFNNNNYVVLFNIYGNSLQVIRPYKDNFDTKTLTASKCTVLAPHLDDEIKQDTPANLMQEFINQTEQYIQILK